MFPGLYSHFSLDGAKHTEYDTDVSLEYEYSETYKHFMYVLCRLILLINLIFNFWLLFSNPLKINVNFSEFYNDIKYELEKYGKLTQLKVCLNTVAHLRGNVYVSFSSEREALVVYRRFNGRFYAGRPVSVEFIDIPVWKSAICGKIYLI